MGPAGIGPGGNASEEPDGVIGWPPMADWARGLMGGGGNWLVPGNGGETEPLFHRKKLH
jgi:hypothetical protein